MKIGLVRHFKVKKGYPENTWVTQKELIKWLEEYDVADIEEGEVDLKGVAWKRCFASDLPRAEKTARKIYDGKIIKKKELREISVYPFIKRDMKLPFFMWAVLARVAWLFNHKSQLEGITDVKRRVKVVLDEILSQSQEDVLIVSHGVVMMFLRKELLKRGFKGPKLGTPKNGKLYVFEK
ncbi:histidine phosphatase family protein [Laceyella putida]|uniref:Histidine phosphatase family protein n=1 Tax=Laceyella putida TaxID=110101 RepID=A0ABW2RHE0_9BACL